MIVVDASVLIEHLVKTSISDAIGARFAEHGESLHAPYLIDIEVAQIIRKFVTRGQLDPARGKLAIENLAEFRITRYPHNTLLPRIWELRHNFTAYDAAYIALAEALSAPLLTRDTGLLTTNVHRAEIELI